MLSSFTKIIRHSQLSLSLLKQQCSLASTSSRSTSGNTDSKDKKATHDLKLDASHQSGTKSQKERTTWENKEQGLTSDTETRQERIPQDKQKNVKNKSSKK